MKPGILLVGKGSNQWIGGLYYIKNIAFVLSQSQQICEKYNIFVLVYKENKEVFSGLPNNIKIVKIPKVLKEFEKFCRVLFCKVNNIKYMFPCSTKLSNFLAIQGISWIPDFQHNQLPEFYDDFEREKRIEENKRILHINYPLVLSSEDCKNDLERFYKTQKENVHVVHFVSYIEPEMVMYINRNENQILKKFNLLDKKYIYIGNQFWQHKNHIVVLEAAKQLLQKKGNQDLYFVFTGKMNDSRMPEYSNKILQYFNDVALSGHLLNCGFIDRIEQLTIMKKANFIIQPSLFEGWGTVLEDAKVLDKTVLLSDIPIHREQKTEKCIMFNPYDSGQLVKLIEHENLCEHHDCFESGIKDMYVRAKEYSKGFEKILDL